MTDKLAESLQNLKIDSKFEYWNELPKEIKQECIKTMDFKMRFQLRSTSRAEKALVDSIRSKIYGLDLFEGCISMRLSEKSKPCTFRYPEDIRFEKLTQFFIYILKHCDFEWFSKFNPSILDEMELDGVVADDSVKIVNLMAKEGFGTTVKFFKKCHINVDKIHVFFDHEVEPIEQMFTIPAVLNANHLTVINHSCQQHREMIEKWMNSDVKIGAKLHLMDIFSCSGEICDMLEERVVCTEGYLRLRTDNSGKHVLMYFDEEQNVWPLCFVIIPASLEKTQCDEYMNK